MVLAAFVFINVIGTTLVLKAGAAAEAVLDDTTPVLPFIVGTVPTAEFTYTVAVCAMTSFTFTLVTSGAMVNLRVKQPPTCKSPRFSHHSDVAPVVPFTRERVSVELPELVTYDVPAGTTSAMPRLYTGNDVVLQAVSSTGRAAPANTVASTFLLSVRPPAGGAAKVAA